MLNTDLNINGHLSEEADDALTPRQAIRITGDSLQVFLGYHREGDYPAASENPLRFSRKVILQKLAEEGAIPRCVPISRHQPPQDDRNFVIPDITGWPPDKIGRFAARMVYHRRNRYKYGAIYVVETVGADFVKIGWAAEDVARRVDSLAVACPFELSLLVEMPGSMQLEKTLHRIFRSSHVRGEWFRGTDEQIKCFIECAIDHFPVRQQAYLKYPEWKRDTETA